MMWRGIRQAARRFVADGGAARCARLGAMGLLVCRALPVAAQAPAGARDTLQLRRTADSLRTTGRDSAAAGMAFVQLGVEYESKLDAPQAARAFEQASALAAATGDSVTLADALQKLGLLYWRVNQYERSLEFLERAKALRMALGDRQALARVLNNIGASYYQLGVYEPALEAFLQSLRLRRDVGDLPGVARTLTNVGKTYHDWRQYARARIVLEEAVATARQSGAEAAVGYALNSLAMLEIDARQFARAHELIGASARAYQASGALVSRADTVDAWSLNASARGLLMVREGRAREAVPILDSVLLAGLDRGSIRTRPRQYPRSGARVPVSCRGAAGTRRRGDGANRLSARAGIGRQRQPAGHRARRPAAPGRHRRKQRQQRRSAPASAGVSGAARYDLRSGNGPAGGGHGSA